MTSDSPDTPRAPRPPISQPGSRPDLPPDPSSGDIDPAMANAWEEDEVLLPDVPEEANEAVPEGPLAVGHAAIEHAVRHAPTSPGVYRMLNAASDVLYVGKAKNVRKRLSSYARVNAPQPARILRMIAATVSVFESRTRPCLLYQIRRCSGPCTGEIDFPGYTELVREAREFLSGRSRLVKRELAGEMEKASAELAFETAALYRDRLAALSAIQSQQGINPRTVEEADVFAIHQEGGYSCVEVFFFRTGQN